MRGLLPLRTILSRPLPQRLEGNDTTNYLQPIPQGYGCNPYQTYWTGNQLPGQYIHTQAAVNFYPTSSVDPILPQRKGGSFGQNLGQVQSAGLIARMQAAWAAHTSSY